MFKDRVSAAFRTIKTQFNLLSVVSVILLLISFLVIGKLYLENKDLSNRISELEISLTETQSMLQVNGRGLYFDNTIVYVNDNGKKYHKRDCQYVTSNSYTKFLTDAEKDGYSACLVCY